MHTDSNMHVQMDRRKIDNPSDMQMHAWPARKNQVSFNAIFTRNPAHSITASI